MIANNEEILFSSTQFTLIDIAAGGILKLIYRNFIRNITHIKCKFCVTELDFLNLNWTKSYEQKLQNVDVILAADGRIFTFIIIIS